MTSGESRPEFVIRGATVVTMDTSIGDLISGDVHVRDGLIVAVAPDVTVDDAVDVIDGVGMIIMPGLVDTHWHLWNSTFRGLVGFEPERGYFPVKNSIAPLMTPDDSYAATMLGLAEAADSGITTLNNWNHNVRSPDDADASLKAHIDAGIRAQFSYGNPDRHPPDQLMDVADVARVAYEWIGERSGGLVTLGMAMRGPVRTEPEICQREWDAARDMGLPMTMHCGGRRTETGRYCDIAGMYENGFLGPDLQVVHAVHANTEEIALLAETGTHISLSPLTELRTMGFPPIGEFLEAGLLVTLSIDSLAIPTNADMFNQMRVALSVELARHPASMTVRKILEMATINGARDLGLEDITGSLTVGKRADLIMLNGTHLNLTPGIDPTITIVMAATPGNVDSVVVDGRFVKRHGALTTMSRERIVENAIRSTQRLLDASGFEVPWAASPAG